MDYKNQRRLLVLVCVVLNLVLWIIPANVLELIAGDDHVLLGRYSRVQFTWMIVALVATLIAFYIGLPNEEGRRRRAFQMIAGFGIGLPLLLGIDAVVTLIRASHNAPYVFDGLAYHRPANYHVEDQFEDRPQAERSFPDRPDGFGKVAFDFRFDERGFRNPAAVDDCDVVVLGDSFAEGSRVTNEDAWPARLADRTGLRIYNLGMSGYDPQHYLASLKRHGLPLKPKLVICMIYEGNDFRSAKWIENPEDYKLPAKKVFQHFLRNSLVISSLDRLFTQTFGRIASRRHLEGGEIFSWMPVRVAAGETTRHYAFSPKRMLRHLDSLDEFRIGRHWANTARNLRAIKESCKLAGAQLVIVYAPDKPHTVLPLVREELPGEKVHAFAELKTRDIPGPDAFMQQLFAGLDAMETVTREFCETESIPFVTFTPALRAAAAAGRQVYYTYDQHWTPIGHEVVTDALLDSLEGRLAAVLQNRSEGSAQKASAILNPSK